MTDSEDVSSVARQLADLTQTVEELQSQLEKFRLGAETQQERADTQQERIDLAARELAEVSDRLQAAATALRQSIYSRPFWEGFRRERATGGSRQFRFGETPSQC